MTGSGKENIVLIGMPGSGKSTVAVLLGERLSLPVFNVDARIQEVAGMPIRDIFARFGEPAFRDMESRAISEASSLTGFIIATGGGSVLRRENVRALKRNGRLFFLDRPLKDLLPSDDRPLGDTFEKIEALYRERMPVYRAAADEIITVHGTPEEIASEIAGRWKGI